MLGTAMEPHSVAGNWCSPVRNYSLGWRVPCDGITSLTTIQIIGLDSPILFVMIYSFVVAHDLPWIIYTILVNNKRKAVKQLGSSIISSVGSSTFYCLDEGKSVLPYEFIPLLFLNRSRYYLTISTQRWLAWVDINVMWNVKWPLWKWQIICVFYMHPIISFRYM